MSRPCQVCGGPICSNNASGICRPCLDAKRRRAIEAREAKRKCSRCSGKVGQKNISGICNSCRVEERLASSHKGSRRGARCADCGKPLCLDGRSDYCQRHHAARYHWRHNQVDLADYLRSVHASWKYRRANQ